VSDQKGAGISVAFEDSFQEDYIWSGPAVGFVDFDSYCSTTLFAAEDFYHAHRYNAKRSLYPLAQGVGNVSYGCE
jgi:hypothetical protein